MRIVVVGTGSIGMRHVGVLRALPGVEVTAVPTRPGRVAELRQQGVHAVPTLEAALGEQPAGAIIATDTGRHARDAEACLGVCPVLVEKPLAPTGVEASRVVATARANGRALHVACCLRFDAGLAWAHAQATTLGAPHFLDVECLSWLPAWRPQRDYRATYSARPGEGGVLLDLVHDIDACVWFGGPLRDLQAQIENRGLVGLPPEVDETAVIAGRHTSGLGSTVRLSYAVQPTTRRLRLWAADGAVEWDGIARIARRFDHAGAETDRLAWTGPDAMYRAQAEAWIASLRDEPAPRLVPGDEGARAVAIVDAARASARSGRREALA